ncbi:D-alanyl-D-alanine carboxypeptidase family protein [Parasporobacterium paucivorans]|uniref:D-alanyl-D-alanine carboxypeptidase n=1 Tax=Parasporobacterium paucivorans DSM 15970 TaxID=1122934 RepID=A0A1M6B8D5_9FIRM|nr:D-alanyl-D-alanine carboxypeptidase family protein [Parasporobacterium paucivorans]SHI44975.1 D-alanyl-D-alanine carboxypeptidase [Parasporobacterium paucivorans DSM 15970]
MKKFITAISAFIILFTCVFSFNTTQILAASESWPAYPEIFAETGVVIEASTGTVLYDKGAHNQMYPASITKVLTALVALHNSSLDETVTFSHDAVFSLEIGDANIGMKEGETLTMEDCLYGLLLASANETANAIAEHVGGSTDGFAKMMNETAKEAGALNSHFTNPSGLFDENHYTTAYDMAMITREAIKNSSFLEIEKNTTHTVGATNLTAEVRNLTNRHKMLFPSNSVYYEGILGGKTGYVDQSGNTLITFARRNNMTLISVVMRSDSYHVYEDTTSLLNYGFDNFTKANVSESETLFSDSQSSSSIFKSDYPAVYIDSKDSVVFPSNAAFSDLTATLSLDKNPDDDLYATLEYSYDGVNVGSASLKTNSLFAGNMAFTPLLTEDGTATEKSGSFNFNVWLIPVIIVVVVLAILFQNYRRKLAMARKRKRLHRKKSTDSYNRF